MGAKPAEEVHPGEILKYQTWVLRVLIHCDGCKKKVKKVLQGIDGVYTTEVDSREHKVTVTGNVDAETLIKRLQREGKIVELWPEKPPAENKKKKPAGKSKGGGGSDSNNKKKELEQNNNNNELVVSDGGGSNAGCTDPAVGDDDIEESSDKEDECDEAAGAGADGGSGEGGKKKKKKKKKNKGENGNSAPPSNNGGGEEAISKVDAAAAEAAAAEAAALSTNYATSFVASKDLIGPSIQHAYPPYPPQYYPHHPPPLPEYGLSYNTAYPVSTTSHYVGAPINVMPMHAYATPYPRIPPPPPPSNPIRHYGDYDEDHEYEGSGCSIM